MIGGDELSEALCAQLQVLHDPVPNARTRRRSSAIASVAGVPLAGFNTVGPRAEPAQPDEVTELLDLVAATGLPHCLQVRARDAERIDPIAEARGLRFIDGLPFYALVGETADVPAPDMEVRALDARQATIHAAVAGVGFALGRDLFETLVTPALLETPGVRAYIGVVDGSAIATGLRVTVGEANGIINVATLPEFRRRGYGIGLTARMVADGLGDGARFSFLASTPEGLGIYRRLGFQEVERWGCWESS